MGSIPGQVTLETAQTQPIASLLGTEYLESESGGDRSSKISFTFTIPLLRGMVGQILSLWAPSVSFFGIWNQNLLWGSMCTATCSKWRRFDDEIGPKITLIRQTCQKWGSRPSLEIFWKWAFVFKQLPKIASIIIMINTSPLPPRLNLKPNDGEKRYKWYYTSSLVLKFQGWLS